MMKTTFTDSLIFLCNKQNDPLAGYLGGPFLNETPSSHRKLFLLEGMLGELTDELEDGERILEAVFCGPKNYAYVTMDGDKRQYKIKIRGFTKDADTEEKITLSTMKKSLLDHLHKNSEPITVKQSKIERVQGGVRTIERTKRYRIVHHKSIFTEKLRYEPFGVLNNS